MLQTRDTGTRTLPPLKVLWPCPGVRRALFAQCRQSGFHDPTMPVTIPIQRPVSVTWLGYGGLIPFLALATACLAWPALRSTWWVPALIGYGAVILSFVGALHWGFAMTLPDLTLRQRHASFAWSVVPSLLAWPALLVPPAAGAALLIAGFAAHLAQDFRLQRIAMLAPWYLRLRVQLTSVACTCLALGAWASTR